MLRDESWQRHKTYHFTMWNPQASTRQYGPALEKNASGHFMEIMEKLKIKKIHSGI